MNIPTNEIKIFITLNLRIIVVNFCTTGTCVATLIKVISAHFILCFNRLKDADWLQKHISIIYVTEKKLKAQQRLLKDIITPLGKS